MMELQIKVCMSLCLCHLEKQVQPKIEYSSYHPCIIRVNLFNVMTCDGYELQQQALKSQWYWDNDGFQLYKEYDTKEIAIC